MANFSSPLPVNVSIDQISIIIIQQTYREYGIVAFFDNFSIKTGEVEKTHKWRFLKPKALEMNFQMVGIRNFRIQVDHTFKFCVGTKLNCVEYLRCNSSILS